MSTLQEHRSLLEPAAKAVGLEDYVYHPLGCGMVDPEGGEPAWNPYYDDGANARMEAQLGINVEWLPTCVMVRVKAFPSWVVTELFEHHGGDKQAARRRASLRLAAMMGGTLA